MKKTTVYLPDGLSDALAAHASRRGLSQAQVVREAIQAAVGADRIRPQGALYASGDPISKRVDELLAEGFGQP
jgi:plasmid stability protein